MSPTARRVATGVASAAALIAAVTVAARAVGFLRQVAFARSVGPATCLNSVYSTVNSVPNIVFEIVAGGALAAAVVPVLAGAVDRADRAEVARTTSALLTWTVAVLLPVTLLGYVLAGPIVRVLLGDGGGCGGQLDLMRDVGTRMLLVFLPQIVLYGLCATLAGVLQAHHRFLSPALAPLVSSVVVIGAYLTYAAMAGDHRGDLTALTRTEELTLSVGTTLGVFALLLSQVPGPLGLRLGLRPTLEFPPAVAARVRMLATAALAVVVAQQLTTVVVIRLANDRGSSGSVGVYTLAWTVFLLPWAILAVPLSTSAFPRLVARHEASDAEGYA